MGWEMGWGTRTVTARPPELREPRPRALSGCGGERSHSPEATRPSGSWPQFGATGAAAVRVSERWVLLRGACRGKATCV